MDLLDFFCPVHISSESRARAFLWLCHHYYEGTTPNPFDDAQSRKKPGLIPVLETLSLEEAALENVDTAEEKAWGEKMTAQRKIFMANKDKLDGAVIADNDTTKDRNMKRGTRGKGRVRRGKALAATSRVSTKVSSTTIGRRGSSPDSRNSPQHVYNGEDPSDGVSIN